MAGQRLFLFGSIIFLYFSVNSDWRMAARTTLTRSLSYEQCTCYYGRSLITMLDRRNLKYLLFLGHFSFGKDVILYIIWVLHVLQR